MFSLVVDDFGIKYVGEEKFQHLIEAIKEDYTVEIHKTGGVVLRHHTQVELR